MQRTVPLEAEIVTWFEKYSNWGRWGADDELGTLNFITPKKRVQAAQTIKEGIVVSCARPIEFEPSTDYPGKSPHQIPRKFLQARTAAQRRGDLALGDLEGEGPYLGGGDSLLIGLHGGARTHLDAPSHSSTVVDGKKKMYNGFSAELATPAEGGKLGVDVIGEGIFSRGILLDIARLHNKEWLEAGEPIFPEDLEAAEQTETVSVEEGDILLIRTGHTQRRLKDPIPGGRWAGLHAACIPWLFERRVAMLATDTPNDVNPSGYPGIKLPVHRIGLGAMGLWLVDHCNHETLSTICAERKRWSFAFTFAPLKVSGVTGIPINPVVVL